MFYKKGVTKFVKEARPRSIKRHFKNEQKKNLNRRNWQNPDQNI